jgi:diguanylate cyclase (GGDEF)-like protein/PAS domain S-box-containing protein
MSSLAQNEFQFAQKNFRAETGASHRRRPLSVLFIHSDADVVGNCLEEFEKARFTVSADFVLTLAQCSVLLRSQSYDVVVAEYPSASWKGPGALQLLHQTVQEIPLLFVTTSTRSEFIAELSAQGAFDYVEREHLAQLPMAVRRVLNEKNLRDELRDAKKALRHSQSLYRALVDNPAYGVYRCNAEGELLDVNQALLAMLGYESKEELLAGNHTLGIIPSMANGPANETCSPEKKQMEPVEQQWKRKDGTNLKVRLSGRGVHDDCGNFAGHEIIAVDVTEQRTLEDQLRLQASTDSLTGLANHRLLFEMLHAEICRSQRTGREFSLVLLDLDGLKKTNDQFGHLTGDRALCRLGQVLRDCCRAIDTAARHGGDEFALVLPETSAAAATLVARRICDLVAEDTEVPALSVSVGIACYPKDADTIGTLLYAADMALYAMKDKQPRAAQAAHACGSRSSVANSSIFPNRK